VTGREAEARHRRPRRQPGGLSRAGRRVLGAAILAWTVTSCSPGIPGAPGGPQSSSPSRVAPYVDITLGAVPDLTPAAGGITTFNLAFVTAASRACQPSWGGRRRYDDAGITARVRTLRDRGGDVRVSFGGARSEELAQACVSVPSLVNAYQKVIDAYQLTLVDFDVEGAGLDDRDAVRRRNLAVSQLQQTARRRGASLRVSYTLPARADGLTPPAQELLREARTAGVEPDAVNVMTMNIGSGSADMAARSMAIAEAAEAFVRSLWTGGRDGSAWSMIAVTPMIGVNDSRGEVFRPGDATRLVAFARQHRLAWLSYWSLNRDRPCPPGIPAVTASPSCSGIDQKAGEFAEILAGYR
jgi:hypothetical protein